MLKRMIVHLLRAPVRHLQARHERKAWRALEPAVGCFRAKNYRQTLDICTAVIARWPRSARAHHLCGQALLALDNPAAAVTSLRTAVSVDPDAAAAHADLAAVLLKTGDLEGAERSCRRAVALRGDHPDDRLLLVEILETAKREPDAIAELLLVQEFAPERFDILIRLFRTLSRLGMVTEALRIAERSVHENGENHETCYLLAAARYGAEDMRGAVEACRKALTYNGTRAEVHVTLGSALFALGEVDSATEAYLRALEIRPDFPDALFHIGLIRLMSGEYREGWQGFEQRFRREKSRTMRPCVPPWDGDFSVSGHLLVMREQGLGDEIMFASCYPELLDHAGPCFIECDPRLEKLFARSFPRAVFCPLADLHTTAQTNPGPEIAARVYAGSLPGFLRNDRRAFPEHNGYLKPDPQRTAHWRRRVEALGAGLKVGISWRGGTVFTHRARRTPPLRSLLPLLSVPGVCWINLQYGDRASDIAELQSAGAAGIMDWPDAIDGDYDETAALVDNLDLVISVCTSVVHLAGALGKPAWVMTARVPEWRYGLHATSMPWYPAVRLFRQATQGVWAPVLAEIEHELRHRVAACGRSHGPLPPVNC